jgi:hypothetical protein
MSEHEHEGEEEATETTEEVAEELPTGPAGAQPDRESAERRSAVQHPTLLERLGSFFKRT